jgi:peptidyl-prolyl cis-trans isomerase D
MLDTLRKGATNVVVKGVLVLLAFSFVAWGIGDIFHGRTDTNVATIKGAPSIAKEEFTQATKLEVAQLQQRFGGALTEEQLKALNIEAIVLGKLINKRLLQQATTTLALEVGNDAAADAIRTNPMFSNSKGEFEKNQFHAILQSNNMNEAMYVAGLKNELAMSFLYDTITAQAPAPKQLVSLLHSYQNEKRVADILTIPANAAKNTPAPSEAEITRYFEAHKAEFTAPEYRTITYLTLTSDDVIKEVTVSDSDARAEFDANIAEYQKPETRDVTNLIFTDEQQARTAYDTLQKSSNKKAGLKKIAAKEGTAVMLKAVTKNELPEEVQDSVFSLAQDSLSEPLKSSFGWHIFYVTAITPPAPAVFEQHRDAIVQKLTRQKATDSLSAIATRMEDDFAAGTTLQEIAAKYKLKSTTIKNINAKGETIDAKKAALPQHINNLLPVAFSTDSGSDSPLTLTPDNNSYFVVHVDKVIASRPQTLDEVRPQIMAIQQKIEQQAANRVVAEDVLKKLKAGTSMKEIASTMHFPLQSGKMVSRNEAFNEKEAAPLKLLENIFAVSQGQLTTVHQAASGEYMIAAVQKIIPADSADEKAVEEIRTALTRQIAGDLSQQYIHYLRGLHPVTIKQELAGTAPDMNASE